MDTIPIEIIYLVASAGMGLIAILGHALLADLEFGIKYGLGNRDNPPETKNLVTSRLKRANANFAETFAIFAAVVIAVTITDRANDQTALGAALYFWARLAYVPLYAFGVQGLRSLAWLISIVGIVIVGMTLINF